MKNQITLEESLKNVNSLWFKAITGEMVLNYKFGLTSRFGSPFAQFRKLLPQAPRNKKDCLIWIKQTFEPEAYSVTLRNLEL